MPFSEPTLGGAGSPQLFPVGYNGDQIQNHSEHKFEDRDVQQAFECWVFI